MYIGHLNDKQVLSLSHLLCFHRFGRQPISETAALEGCDILPEYLFDYCDSLDFGELLSFHNKVIAEQVQRDKYRIAQLRYDNWLKEEQLAIKKLIRH